MHLCKPLNTMQCQFLEMNLDTLASHYQTQFQKHLLNADTPQELLNEPDDSAFDTARATVTFPAAKDGYSHPAFTVTYLFYYKKLKDKDGYLAKVPALSLECFAANKEQLESNVREVIQLDFIRHRRLQNLQSLISTLWYESQNLLSTPVVLKIYKPGEQKTAGIKKQTVWLNKTARLLHVESPAAFGREQELKLLKKHFKSPYLKNVLLVGPNGIGKTALIWEFARQSSPMNIDMDIWQTTASLLIKELSADSGWQDNIVALCKELENGPRWLFVRNLMDLFEVGRYEGNNISIAQYLKTWLERGSIRLISECTEQELAQIELISPDYSSHFHIIRLGEPTDMEVVIQQKIKQTAPVKNISLEEDTIREALQLQRRFYPYSGFPGKPIRFLESAILSLGDTDKKLTRDTVLKYFCEETGIPRLMVDDALPMPPEEVYAFLNRRIFGQPMAIRKVVDVLGMVKTGLVKPGKPIASFLFAGPTGVGKTELAKTIADFIFGDKTKVIRFDMSEFTTYSSLMRLRGGNYQKGLLTSAVQQMPFSVVLFDEIEKAHPDFYDLLLQILGEGRLTDSSGKMINFCSTIVIMTANIGTARMPGQQIGWKQSSDPSDLKTHFSEAVQKYFKPELYNRIDQIIPFEALTRAVTAHIVERELALLQNREGIKHRPVTLKILPEVKNWLADKGYSAEYGARQIQRTIHDLLVLPLARTLNQFDADLQLAIEISIKQRQIAISVETDEFSTDYLLAQYERYTWADVASQLRRRLNQVDESYAYNMLKEQLEKSATDTTTRKKQPLLYRAYSEKLQLEKELNQLEMESSLAALGHRAYNAEWEKLNDALNHRIYNLKYLLARIIKEGDNEIIFALYGTQPQYAWELYQSLCAKKEFSITQASVIQQKNKLGKSNVHDLDHFDLHSLKNCQSVIGIAFKVIGPLAGQYFSEEPGLQIWKPTPQETYPVLIRQPSEMPERLPEQVFRKDTYKKEMPYRTISAQKLKDNRLKINLSTENLAASADILLSALDERFQSHIETIIR